MTVKELLEQTGETAASALKEYLTLLALSKISRYEAECALFECKYAEPFESLKQRIDAMTNEEDFGAEDDLMDWEFAYNALRTWREKLDAIRHAD